MLKTELLNLSDGERRMLEDAFHEGTSPRRTRGTVLSGLVVVLGVVLLLAVGASVWLFAVLTLATLGASTIEKLVSQKNMTHYESLLRKVVNRLESVEHVPPTPQVASDATPAVNVTDDLSHTTRRAKAGETRSATEHEGTPVAGPVRR